jgi:hypothetical protein
MTQKIGTALFGGTVVSGIVGVQMIGGLLLWASGHQVLGTIAMAGGVFTGLALAALGVLGVFITQMKRF